jgi:hypothetical protein
MEKPKLIERHPIMVNGPIAKVMAMDPIDHVPNKDYGVAKLKRRILQNKTISAIKRPMY